MKFNVFSLDLVFINVNFLILLIILHENDFVLMKYILKYLDIKGYCICYLLPDDPEKFYIYICIYMHVYILHM